MISDRLYKRIFFRSVGSAHRHLYAPIHARSAINDNHELLLVKGTRIIITDTCAMNAAGNNIGMDTAEFSRRVTHFINAAGRVCM